MKKWFFRAILTSLAVILLSTGVWAAQTLVPVGRTVGLELDARGVTVAEFDRELGQAARQAGLREGDMIVKADGSPVATAQDLQKYVSRCKEKLVLTVLREGQELNLTLTPVPCPEGKRLGIFVRSGITGIGTVTYYDPETGDFGALGHGVSDRKGNLLPLEAGAALEAEVVSIQKGKVGTPGQLRGAFRQDRILGDIRRNTPCGVFGTAPAGWPGTPLPVAQSEEIHTGEAIILSNLTGTEVEEFQVEIIKISPGSRAAGRNLLIHVTDDDLIARTGGIVQGMSGSPIIQDGKLIGAVTHVLVNDPTTGYGIFIENMLDAAG